MKSFTKILTILLAVLMLVSVFAACSNQTDDNPTETTTAQANPNGGDESNAGEETTENNLDANGFIKDNLPDNLNFNNEEVVVLHWKAERDEFSSEGISGDNILDNIYQRNMNIEERLGVSLTFVEEKGDNKNIDVFLKRVANSFQAGDKEYDIIATYSRTAGKLAIQGYYADLNEIDDSYIDQDMPWWPESIIDTMGVGDALYYVSGDASTNTLHFMYTIYYNKDLINSLGLTDPTEYVLNKTWTLDKLIEMSSGVYQDLDNSGSESAGDYYGFCTIYYGCDAFYTGSGLKLVERTNDDDLIKISDDFSSEKAINLVDKLGKWLTSADTYVDGDGSNGNCTSGSNYEPFVAGTCLFAQNRVYLADNQHGSGLNSVDWKYGLVPTPLYDENQENYITVIGNPFTLYGIMTDCDNPSMMSAVVECWGSEAYRLTTPAIFETNMKYKYTELDVSAQMFDILRETSSFDQGRIYSNTLGPYISELPSKAMCNGQSWATIVKQYQKLLPKQINNIISSFQKIQG